MNNHTFGKSVRFEIQKIYLSERIDFRFLEPVCGNVN